MLGWLRLMKFCDFSFFFHSGLELVKPRELFRVFLPPFITPVIEIKVCGFFGELIELLYVCLVLLGFDISVVNLALFKEHVGEQVEPITEVQDLLLDDFDFLLVIVTSSVNSIVVRFLTVVLVDSLLHFGFRITHLFHGGNIVCVIAVLEHFISLFIECVEF